MIYHNTFYFCLKNYMIFKDVILYTLDEDINNEPLKYVVILSSHWGKQVWVKHKERETREIPWGKIDFWENIFQAAKRELQEETGAGKFSLQHIGYYSLVNANQNPESKNFGALFYADIEDFDMWWTYNTEIEKYSLFDKIPDQVTYPDVHPLFQKSLEKLLIN